MKSSRLLTIIFSLIFINGYSQLNSPGQAILKLTVDKNGEITVVPLKQENVSKKQCRTIKPFAQKNNIHYSDQIEGESFLENFSNQDYFKNDQVKSSKSISNACSKNINSNIHCDKIGIENAYKIVLKNNDGATVPGQTNTPKALPNAMIYTGEGSVNYFDYSTENNYLDVYTSIGNSGTVTAWTFRVGVYLSTNTIISPSSDVLVNTTTITNLLANYYQNINVSADLDNLSLSGGTYYIGIYADDNFLLSESDETDNNNYFNTTISYAPATSVNLLSYTGEGAVNSYNLTNSNNNLIVRASVQNNGISSASEFRIGFYLSTDYNVESSDVLIGSSTVESLLNSYYSNVSIECILDEFELSEGSYYICVFFDDLGQVSETNEEDNVIYFTDAINYTPIQYPNLITYSGDGSVNNYNFDSETSELVIKASVGNAGLAGAENFRVGFYLMESESSKSNAILLDTIHVNALNASYYKNLSDTTILNNKNISTGTYYVMVFYDDLLQISETLEEDNIILFTDAINYTEPTLPNLSVYSGTEASNSYYFDESSKELTINSSISNFGNSNASAFRVGYYLLQSESSKSVYLLDTSHVASLVQENYQNLQNSINIASLEIAEGSYYVSFIIDDTELIEESNEDDNIVIFNETFTYIPPELANLYIYTESEAENYFELDGQILEISTSVANDGAVVAENFRVGWYLSTDESWESLAYFVNATSIISLDPGYYSTVSSSTNLSTLNVEMGEYYVWIIVDDEFVIEETDEADNVNYFNTAMDYIIDMRPNICYYNGSDADNSLNYNLDSHEVDANIAIENTGNELASDFRIGMYISTDDRIETSDILVKSKTVKSLSAGSTKQLEFLVDLDDFSLESNTYYVGFIFDDESTIEETSESDNDYCFSSSINYLSTLLSDIGEKLKVYPNPVSDILFLKDYNFNTENITVYNVTGHMVMEINVLQQSVAQINVREWPSGVYCLVLQNKNGSVIQKIIKQ